MHDRLLKIIKSILWLVVGAGAAVLVLRFAFGLGTVTALSDVTPWGLWKCLNVFAGIAVAAGGFTVAAIAHVAHVERFHHIARRAVLIGICGYFGAGFSLTYEIGVPWKIWGPIVFWNPSSPLFEVSWCVMIYLNILFIEFAPVVLEWLNWDKLRRFFLKLQTPAVILGIAISTLHQSTLGTIFLIAPQRLHGLWYSSLLPYLFFVSAIGCGLAVVVLASDFVNWIYNRARESKMLASLSAVAGAVLTFYGVFRLVDIARIGNWALLTDGSPECLLFWAEFTASTIIPVVLLAIPAVRRSASGRVIATVICATGFVLQRLAVSGIAMAWITGSRYVPTFGEFAVSGALIAGMALFFLFAQENLPVEPEEVDRYKSLKQKQLFSLPTFDRPSEAFAGEKRFPMWRVYSALAIVGAALAFAATPQKPLVRETPVERARGGELLRVGYPHGTVLFPHAEHITRLGKDQCGTCHHFNLRGEEGTACSTCHQDLYLATRVFDHDVHSAREGSDEAACFKCHTEGEPKTVANAKACVECHKDDMAEANPVLTTLRKPEAPGMAQAMHRMCIGCHRDMAEDPAVGKPNLFQCASCHRTPVPHVRQLEEERGRRAAVGLTAPSSPENVSGEGS